MEKQVRQTTSNSQDENIAVIGSGIAGCLAAYELAMEGFGVSIIEERH